MSRFKKRFQGLYWRQLFVTAGMVMLTLFLLGASFFSLSYNYARSQKSEELVSKAQIMAQLSVSYLETGRNLSMEELRNDRDFQRLATFAATVSDVHFMICDTQGRVLLTTDSSLDGMVVTMPEKMTEEIREKGAASTRGDLGGLYPQKRLVVGVQAVNPESREAVGEVFAISTTLSLDAMWKGFIGLFFMTAFVVLMIAFAVCSVTTMRQIKPIREMAQATRLYAEGDFDIRMKDYGRSDEIGELAASFNRMAETLQQTERKRRDFIANISHELKTPMTTIAGFAEGILDGTIPPEREKESLQIIVSETRRLSRLVRRMLDLSRLNALSENTLTAQEQFDLTEVVSQVLISLEGKITGRNLDVDVQMPEDKLMVWGDTDSITQVCYNLVDNAAKFAAPGTTITVQITKKDGKAYTTIRNLGATVPPEELPLLFDRFHKADYSRSMDREGVGLGLYIVKTILNNLKEDITVTSEDGVTQFTFTLTLA